MAITTDPVADLLTRIRNANRAYHDSLEIVKILEREGFIKGHEVISDPKQDRIKVYLKFASQGNRRGKVLTDLKRISKPGLRVYASSDRVPRVLRGLGIAILTTSQGVMTDKEARRKGIGGEVLCYVW